MSQQATFSKLVKSSSGDLHKLLDGWKSGALSTDDLGDEVYDVLLSGHTDAYILGARQAGTEHDAATLRTIAEQFGRGAADAEQQWLDGFLSDLDDGRYTDDEGNVNVASIENRASMYGHKLRGTANQAWLDESHNDATFTWVMSGAEEHCPDCPRMAALSPYTALELFTVPGACDTECKTGCKCHLVRDDGVESLKRPDTAKNHHAFSA